MMHSNSLGRATYVVVDDATGEAYTGSSPQHAQDQRRQAEQDRNPPPTSHATSTATPTSPIRRGKSLRERAFDRQKKNKRKEQKELWKKGLRNNPRINGDEPAIVEADRAVQLRAALSRIYKLKEAKGELFKRHSDAQKALSSTRKYLYGSLALNVGLIAYCIFKR